MMFLFGLIGVLGIFMFDGLIYYLRHRKFNQPIYELSPETHQAKANTPSLGGVGIWIIIFLGTWMTAGFNHPSIQWIFCVWTLFAGIGFLDDWKAIKGNRNQGLSAVQKFVLQCVLSAGMLWMGRYFGVSLSWQLIGIGTFWLTAFSNATNLTDGLDGLLAGLALITILGLGLKSYVLHLMPLTHHIMVVGIAFFAFWIWNRHPAKLFMGDTGSLAFGAWMAAVSLYLDSPTLCLPLGIVYGIEVMSVIIQVGVYKRTKKRVFLMAPLHHHFEKLGFSERQVVYGFWGIGWVGFLIFVLTSL